MEHTQTYLEKLGSIEDVMKRKAPVEYMRYKDIFEGLRAEADKLGQDKEKISIWILKTAFTIITLSALTVRLSLLELTEPVSSLKPN